MIKPKHDLRVALTKIVNGVITFVESDQGAPKVPKIGEAPNKDTQNILLIDLITHLNKPKNPSKAEGE